MLLVKLNVPLNRLHTCAFFVEEIDGGTMMVFDLSNN